MCSRFDFNVYSYESEWTIGAEWWTRRRAKPATPDSPIAPDMTLPGLSVTPPAPLARPPEEEISGVVKAKASTSTASDFVFHSSSHLTYLFRRFLSCGKDEYTICLLAWGLFPI